MLTSEVDSGLASRNFGFETFDLARSVDHEQFRYKIAELLFRLLSNSTPGELTITGATFLYDRMLPWSLRHHNVHWRCDYLVRRPVEAEFVTKGPWHVTHVMMIHAIVDHPVPWQI